MTSEPMTGRKILLLDDDPWILRMVRTVLERKGHEVESASDGVEGLEKTASFLPDLIIADIMMPRMNGWSFVRALRSHHNQHMSLVPVIFLTGLNSEEDRVLGFRLGADDYLPKPFRFEELDLRVDKALRSSRLLREQIAESNEELPVLTADEETFKEKEPSTRVSLAGSLEQLGVGAVLTIMEMERKSGVLVFRGLADAVVRVFLMAGQPVEAITEGDGARGAEAIYAVLYWQEGSFEFSASEVDMDDQINMPVTHLLMEGARLMDEAGLDG